MRSAAWAGWRGRPVASRPSAARWRTFGAPVVAGVLAASLVACGSATTSPSASGPAGSTPPAATGAPATPAPTPTPAYADTLRIGHAGEFALMVARGWQGGELMGVPSLTFGELVYSGLYRYDGRDDAVPDLADGDCFVPGSDSRVLRCRLVETTFHDGSPLTADDVASTYQVFMRPINAFQPGPAPTGSLEEVRVVDARTVDFVLSSVDPTFATLVLPLIPIFPRHAIEAAVTDFDTRTRGLTSKELVELADTINAELSRDPQECTVARVSQTTDLLARLGFTLYREDWELPNGTFDACGWLGFAAYNLGWTTSNGGSFGWALAHTGIDRVASIVGFWEAFVHPFPGTGPYRLLSQDADHVRFEAWPGYHGGVAATRHIELVRAAGDGSDLAAGRVDIMPGADLGTAFAATAAASGVQVVTPPTGGYYVLTFNVREGRLFSEADLRKALQLCIDLPRDVDAATGGAGIPIWSPVMPGSWGEDPDLPKPERDTAAAKRLIEGSGWALGPDAVYARDGAPLAAEILVRGSRDDRVKMTGLIAHQARDCGMDLRTKSLGEDAWDTVFTYPHDIPGTTTPFDVYLNGWITGPDPASGFDTYSSKSITSKESPDSDNFGGFSDPVFDRPVAAAGVTYDQAERARLYREAQQVLAAQVPAIFLWAANGYDALRTAVRTVDGPLDLTAPNWAWAPERLVVAADR